MVQTLCHSEFFSCVQFLLCSVSDQDFQLEKVNSLQSLDSFSVIGRNTSDLLTVTSAS